MEESNACFPSVATHDKKNSIEPDPKYFFLDDLDDQFSSDDEIFQEPKSAEIKRFHSRKFDINLSFRFFC